MAMARSVSVPRVPIEHRLAVSVKEPRVGSTSGEKWNSRSMDSPMTVRDAVWRSLALKCIRHAMMNDDVGQQRLHAAEPRVAPAGGQLAVATRVEAAQEGPDEEMTEALAASSVRNVRPRAAETSSRLEDVYCRASKDQRRWVFRMTQGSRQLTSRQWASARWR